MLKVKDIMGADLIYKEAQDLLSDVIDVMVRNNVSSVTIMRNGIPVGIITERDVVRKLKNEGVFDLNRTAESLMSAPIRYIEKDASCIAAANKMSEYAVKRLVVEDRGEIVGVITQTDIVRNLSKLLG